MSNFTITPEYIQLCQQIHHATDKMFADDGTLIKAITSVRPENLDYLAQSYKASYGQDILDVIKQKTSGDYQKLLQSLIKGSFNIDAEHLRKSVKGLGTNEKLMIELLTGRNNFDIAQLKLAYKRLFDRELEKDLIDDLSGHLKQWVQAIISGARDESCSFNDVNADVLALHNAGQAKFFGVDESTFISILATRGIPHLQRVFVAYHQRHNMTLDAVIAQKFSGHLLLALSGFFASVINYPLWVATEFEAACAGIGTDEDKLIRLAVRTREPLLKVVKDAYQQRYGKPLVARVEGDTSGDFRKTLSSLLNQ